MMRQSSEPYDRVCDGGLSSSPLSRYGDYALAYPNCLGAAFVATDNLVEAFYPIFGVRLTRLPIWTGAENSPVHRVHSAAAEMFGRSYPPCDAVSSAIP